MASPTTPSTRAPSFYGQALNNGIVYNAVDACTRLGINGDKMNDLVQKMTRLPSKAQLSSPGRTHSYSLDGAPRLSPEIIDLLNLVSPLGLSLAEPQNLL